MGWFGFGKGKVEVVLEKYQFSPGESIKGKVSLSLNKVVKARGMKIRLVGEKKTSQMPQIGIRREIKLNRQSRTTNIFDFTLPLDKAGDYSGNKEYNFEIKIPENVLQNEPNFGEGMLGTFAKLGQAISGTSNRIRWYLQAYLDVPMGFDISKTVEINVGWGVFIK